MKFTSAVLLLALSLGSSLSFAQSTVEQTPVSDVAPALLLIKQLQDSFSTRNYELSFIKTRQGAIEPMRYIHGLVDDVEVAHLLNLNGPTHESVYRNGKVAYFEQGQPPYSVSSNRLANFFSSIAKLEIERLQQSYELVIAGKSRVAGRPAQVIRVLPKAKDRYAVFLWIDYQSSLPLRVDLVGSNGELIEQYMAVTLIDFVSPTDWMNELAIIELPSVISNQVSQAIQTADTAAWELSWIPEGMRLVSEPGQSKSSFGGNVDSLRYSDGLFDISVYVNKLGEQVQLKEQLLRQGATTLHIQMIQGHEVTVVGEIPPETAAKMANSIRFNAAAKRAQSAG